MREGAPVRRRSWSPRAAAGRCAGRCAGGRAGRCRREQRRRSSGGGSSSRAAAEGEVPTLDAGRADGRALASAGGAGRAGSAACCVRVVSVLLVETACWVRGALGQAGRPGFTRSHQGSALREGYLRQHPHTPAPTQLKRPFADAGLLLVHSCVPEQRQPEAAGSTCWCFWEPPAH